MFLTIQYFCSLIFDSDSSGAYSILEGTHPHTHRASDLAYADGVMYKALREVEDSVRGKWVIIPQQERQQVCGHVLELPGPERQADT